MSFKIDWASLIVGSKCTVSALSYFVFERNFPRISPWGAYFQNFTVPKKIQTDKFHHDDLV